MLVGAYLGRSLGHYYLDGSMLWDLTHGHHDVIVFSFVEVVLPKVTTYNDDPVGSKYLELEVSVVWDGHELGIAWTT